MGRIKGVDPNATQGYIARVLAAQAATWGSPLLNHLIYARRPAHLPIDEQPFPIVAALSRRFAEAAARGELRAGLEAEAATRICLTSVLGLLIGFRSAPAQRRADFALLFSLYLGGDAP